MESTGELLDKRRTYTFYVDDALIDHFAPQIGVYGIAVYVLLVRHAKNHKAFPSYKRITERLGIGRATVVRTLKTLAEVGLIKIEQRTSSHGDADTNLYIIQDLSHLRGSICTELPSSTQSIPSSPEIPGVVLHRDQGGICTELEGILFKESHRKESHLEENPISAVVENSTPAAPKPTQSRVAQWPGDMDDEDQKLHDFLATQHILTAIKIPMSYDWWCQLSFIIDGMPEVPWLEREFAKVSLWLQENPRRLPTPRGASRFIRGWLERAYERDRRAAVWQPPQTREVHIHYASNGRR